MIAFLEGEVIEKDEHSLVIQTGGVGYRVEISTQTLSEISAGTSGVRLLIYHHFTDSDQRLFGFLEKREKRLFEHLITVKGVGPKLGLTIISGMDAGAIMEAIVEKDIQGLSRIPGIGKKTAERIVLELKEKMIGSAAESTAAGADSSAGSREEAIAALEALGFRNREAESAVMAAVKSNSGAGVSEIVKKALIELKAKK